MLALYNSVFATVSPDQICEPDYKEKQKENTTTPHPPKEIIEAQLLRISDLSIFIKLVQWQIEVNWAVLVNYEGKYSEFKDTGKAMVKENPPEVINHRV